MIKWEPGQQDIVVRNVRVRLLGDPHRGRRYINGVPLHRRGEREKMSADAFKASFEGEYDVHICVGDIFDKFVVPPEVVLEVAKVYEDAATENPFATFCLVKGNHDASRDADLRSSFDILIELLQHVENIYITDEEPVTLSHDMLDFCLIPWHPFINADQMMDWFKIGSQFDMVVGHWDVDDFGGDNVIPSEKLFDITPLAITGHVHKAHRFERDGLDVIVTGSMLPQAHGEEINADMFVTTTLAGLEKLGDISNKCVRIILQPGEDMPADLDCLQLVSKRVSEEGEEIDLENVELGNFDMEVIWTQTAEEHELSDSLRDEIWASLKAKMDSQ